MSGFIVWPGVIMYTAREDDDRHGGTCCVCSYFETLHMLHGDKWPKHIAEASAAHIKADHEPACS